MEIFQRSTELPVSAWLLTGSLGPMFIRLASLQAGQEWDLQTEAMDHLPPRMTVAELDAFLRVEMPQLFRHASIAIEHADGTTCRVREAYNDGMLRPGNTISGPTLMALTDLAMWVVLLSAIGPVGLSVTTNLNINFLSKAPAGHDVIAEARLLKLGKRLAVGEITLYSAAGPEPVAHATSTYSIPPKRD